MGPCYVILPLPRKYINFRYIDDMCGLSDFLLVQILTCKFQYRLLQIKGIHLFLTFRIPRFHFRFHTYIIRPLPIRYAPCFLRFAFFRLPHTHFRLPHSHFRLQDSHFPIPNSFFGSFLLKPDTRNLKPGFHLTSAICPLSPDF